MSTFLKEKSNKNKPRTQEASENSKVMSSDWEGIYGTKSLGSKSRSPKAKQGKMAKRDKQYTNCEYSTNTVTHTARIHNYHCRQQHDCDSYIGRSRLNILNYSYSIRKFSFHPS
jgi:hypothetical protein